MKKAKWNLTKVKCFNYDNHGHLAKDYPKPPRVSDIGWKHTKGEPLFTKKRWCITSIILHNKLKSWWYPLIILNTSKKFKILHHKILELKVHFESKLILIQWLNEEDWIKLMYVQYVTYSFSMTIRPHVCCSWNITKQKKIEKIMQCPCYKISSSLIW